MPQPALGAPDFRPRLQQSRPRVSVQARLNSLPPPPRTLRRIACQPGSAWLRRTVGGEAGGRLQQAAQTVDGQHGLHVQHGSWHTRTMRGIPSCVSRRPTDAPCPLPETALLSSTPVGRAGPPRLDTDRRCQTRPLFPVELVCRHQGFQGPPDRTEDVADGVPETMPVSALLLESGSASPYAWRERRGMSPSLQSAAGAGRPRSPP